MVKEVLLVLVQGVWIILFAPLLSGIINKSKALMQGRRGPRLLQPYYDVLKYFQKDALFSIHISWLTIATPYIVFGVTFTSGLLLPIISDGLTINGDLLLVVYLLAMGRFFAALAAIDTGSSFGGMGASRELALNTVIEPAFLLAVLAIIIHTGSTKFVNIIARLGEQDFLFSLPYLLAMFAMLLVILGETGRIPVDNIDTHLELTMIHEGMNIEYSGRYYALLNMGSMIKQLLFMSIFIAFFFPFGQLEPNSIGAVLFNISLFSIKLIILSLFISFIEMMYAKIRLYQVPRLYVTSMTLSVLAILVNVLF